MKTLILSLALFTISCTLDRPYQDEYQCRKDKEFVREIVYEILDRETQKTYFANRDQILKDFVSISASEMPHFMETTNEKYRTHLYASLGLCHIKTFNKVYMGKLQIIYELTYVTHNAHTDAYFENTKTRYFEVK